MNAYMSLYMYFMNEHAHVCVCVDLNKFIEKYAQNFSL